jgi:hypothetical protein
MTPVFIFEWCRSWGFERASSAERAARMSATHGSAKATSPAAKAAPLPDELRSPGYPATNSPRGKAQAGKSPLPTNCRFERAWGADRLGRKRATHGSAKATSLISVGRRRSCNPSGRGPLLPAAFTLLRVNLFPVVDG